MKIQLRRLLQEGLLDTLKNNSGTLALGLGGLAAGAGVFGDDIQDLTHTGVDNVKEGIGKMADYYKPGESSPGLEDSHNSLSDSDNGSEKDPVKEFEKFKDNLHDQVQQKQDALDDYKKDLSNYEKLDTQLNGGEHNNIFKQTWDDNKGKIIGAGAIGLGGLGAFKGIKHLLNKSYKAGANSQNNKSNETPETKPVDQTKQAIKKNESPK